MKSLKKVTFIGAGSWGTAVALGIAESFPDVEVCFWAYEKSVVRDITNHHENRDYIPGIMLPHNIIATNSLKDAVADSQAVILATPSKIVADFAHKLKKMLPHDIRFGFLTKGFCKVNDKIYTISQTIEKEIPFLKNKTVAIYGPSHAEEVVKKYHTCLNVASPSYEDRHFFSELITNEFLQCRETDDIIGVEVGGTLKNPAAIAAGMISMLPNCGDNLAGALISEALKEMMELARFFKVREETIYDISGLGDLVATALSTHSRNRRFGQDISSQISQTGKAVSIFDKVLLRFNPDYVIKKMSENLHYLAEGAYAIEPLIELADSNGLSIPVYRSLYEVLLNKKDPSLLIETIKNPQRFDEHYNKTKIQISSRKKGLEGIKGTAFKDVIKESTENKFINPGKNKDSADARKSLIIKSLKSYLLKNNQKKSLQKDFQEEKLLKDLDEKNFRLRVRKLISYYIDDIIDRYNNLWKTSFVILMKTILFYQSVIKKNLSIEKSGHFKALRKIKGSSNVIYVSIFKNLFDFLFIISVIHKEKLAFPRFFVPKEAVKSTFQRYILRKSGGFFVDESKLSNIIYREALSRYIATMINNGVPLLYFPENKPQTNISSNKIKYDFFSILIESLYSNTVDIALVPVVISYWAVAPSISLTKPKAGKTDIHFASPIYLSDFTTSPHSITGISEIVKTTWQDHQQLYPHVVVGYILEEMSGKILFTDLEPKVREFFDERNLKGSSNPGETLAEGIDYLVNHGIISMANGVITKKGQNKITTLSQSIANSIESKIE